MFEVSILQKINGDLPYSGWYHNVENAIPASEVKSNWYKQLSYFLRKGIQEDKLFNFHCKCGCQSFHTGGLHNKIIGLKCSNCKLEFLLRDTTFPSVKLACAPLVTTNEGKLKNAIPKWPNYHFFKIGPVIYIGGHKYCIEIDNMLNALGDGICTILGIIDNDEIHILRLKFDTGIMDLNFDKQSK